MTFVIMGASGHTGRPAAEALLVHKAKVRVLGRSADKLKEFTTKGAEAAVGDPMDAAFLTKAFAGAEGVYAMLPPDYASTDPLGNYARLTDALIIALGEAKVRRVVFLSSLGAEHAEGTGPIKGLGRTERRLQALGIDVVALRAGYFFENLFGNVDLIKHQGINGGAIAPDVKVAMVATTDIGRVAADTLHHWPGKGFLVREVLGAADLTMREVTTVIGKAIGKPELAYVQFSYEAFAGALTQHGFSAITAGLMAEMSLAANEGRIVSNQGRNDRNTSPTTFEKWVPALAAAVRGA